MPGQFHLTGKVQQVTRDSDSDPGVDQDITVLTGWVGTLISNYPSGVPLPDGSDIDYIDVRTVTLLSDGSISEDGVHAGISLTAHDPAVFATPLQWTIKPGPVTLTSGKTVRPKPWTFNAPLDGVSVTLGSLTPVVGIPLSPAPATVPWASVTGKPFIPSGEAEYYANLAAFPGTGVAGLEYVANDTGKIYRWNGSAYVELSAGQPVNANLTALSAGATAIVAPPTGVAATDTAAIQAAHDGLPSGGGQIWLNGGVYALTATGVTISKRCKIKGIGPCDKGLNGGSQLVSNAINATALTVSADGCVIEDIAIINLYKNTGTVTSGTGLLLTNSDLTQIDRCFFYGFYNNIYSQAGAYYRITNCSIMSPFNYGIWMQNSAGADFGDNTVRGCIFDNPASISPVSAIRWEAGGGLRVTNCKFIGGYGTHLDLAFNGSTVSTANIFIHDNSFEGTATYAINMSRTAGSQAVYRNLIQHNEFAVSGTAIRVGQGWADNIITDNVFDVSPTGIVLAANSGPTVVETNGFTSTVTTTVSVSGSVAAGTKVYRQEIFGNPPAIAASPYSDELTGSVIPAANNTYNLGGGSNYWLQAYLATLNAYNLWLFGSGGHITKVVQNSGATADQNVQLPDASITLGGQVVTEYVGTTSVSGVAVPAGARAASLLMISPGTGGGSGRRGAAGTARCGGGGGSSGGVTQYRVPVSSLGSTYSVTIPAPGSGGAAVTADNTDGNNGGGPGSNTAFASGSLNLIVANGDVGHGGTATSGAGASFGGVAFGSAGNAGPSADTSGGAGNGLVGNGSGPGLGGSGGGITSGNTAGAGGPGSPAWLFGGGYGTGSGVGAGNGGVVGGASPTQGNAALSGVPGNGAGGGAASITGAAQAGANALGYGAGGSGGGASLNGNNSGAGGAGGPGYVRIVWEF